MTTYYTISFLLVFSFILLGIYFKIKNMKLLNTGNRVEAKILGVCTQTEHYHSPVRLVLSFKDIQGTEHIVLTNINNNYAFRNNKTNEIVKIVYKEKNINTPKKINNENNINDDDGNVHKLTDESNKYEIIIL